MIVASLVVMVAFSVILPIVLPENAYTVSDPNGASYFKYRLSDFMQMDSLFFLLIIAIAALCVLVLSCVQNKTVYVFALAGSIGAAAYFGYLIVKVFSTYYQCLEASKEYRRAFMAAISPATIWFLIALSLYILLVIALITITAVRMVKSERKARMEA